MEKHTPEPWRVNDQSGNGWLDNAIYVSGNRGENLARVYRDFGNAEANASRIVACVNACAGIPQNGLDAGMTMAGLLLELAQEQEQRDQLLEALKASDEALELEGFNDDGPTRKVIRAAIAKATGSES